MRGNTRGAALLLVITVIGLLAFLTAEFQRRSHLEAVVAANTLQSLQAHALVRSGYAAGLSILRRDADENTTDSRLDLWAGPGGDSAHIVPIGDYAISLKIEDALGKFPLGSLVDAAGKAQAARVDAFERLLGELGLQEADPGALTDALVDWIDKDSTNDRFEFNDKFAVPNAPLLHLSELSRIEGFNRLSPEDMRKIQAHVDTRLDNSLNVNTAPVPVLMLLSANFSRDDAQRLYEELSATPDTSGSAVAKYVSPNPSIFKPVYASDRFRVKIDADVLGVVRKAECVVKRDKANRRIELSDWTQY